MRYLITTDLATAQKYSATLDEACGYPNPATLTERAVNIETLPDGRYAVPVPDGIYAPKLDKAIEAASVLPRGDESAADSDAALTAQKKALEDSGKLSKTPAKGDPANYLLATRDYVETKKIAVAEPVEPITDILDHE